MFLMISLLLSLALNFVVVQSAQHCRYNQWLNGQCEVNTTDCNVTSAIGMCSTCEPGNCTVYTGMCRHGWNPHMTIPDSQGYVLQVTSCEDLTNKTCGPLNRRGPLCSKCLPGFGPSPYATSFSCYSCQDKLKVWLWLLYLLLELLPPMIFYLLIIVFGVQLTSPPYTSIILFCQLFSCMLYNNTYINLYLRLYANKHFVSFVFTILNIWNLDFLRYIVPPFCISSSLSDRDVLILNLVSGVFPCVLVLVSYIGIEMHARNFAAVIYIWKPFRIFTKFRHSWDPKSSILAGFATFLMISFSKIQFLAYELYFPIHYSKNDEEYQTSLYDLNIIEKNDLRYVQSLFSTPYFLPISILSVLLYIPTILILFYPTKYFHRIFSHTRFCFYNTISVLADAFQGHYKNGTSGTRDYRPAFSCSFFLYIVFNVAMCLYSSRLNKPEPLASVMIYSLLIVSLFYAIVQPCKKSYMNVIESLVYALGSLVMLNLSSGFKFVLGTGVIGIIHSCVLYFTLFLILLPSLVFMGSVIVKIVLLRKSRTCAGKMISRYSSDGLKTESGEFVDHVDRRRMEYVSLP